MKSIVSILFISLLLTACQQSRLINIRNLTLVEGKTEMIDVENENELQLALDANNQMTFERPQTFIENHPFVEQSIDQQESEAIDLSTSQADFAEETNDIKSEIIIPNIIVNPKTTTDSTKTESEKPSKKVSKNVLGILGGISLLVFLIFAGFVVMALVFIIYLLSFLFSFG